MWRITTLKVFGFYPNHLASAMRFNLWAFLSLAIYKFFSWFSIFHVLVPINCISFICQIRFVESGNIGQIKPATYGPAMDPLQWPHCIKWQSRLTVWTRLGCKCGRHGSTRLQCHWEGMEISCKNVVNGAPSPVAPKLSQFTKIYLLKNSKLGDYGR